MPTLADIQTKVRRLTRTPSTNQMSDVDLTTYINNFYQFDLSERLRLWNEEVTLTWWTNPNQDVYPTDTSISPESPLYDFQNSYVTTDQPMYCAGYEMIFTQSRTQFYRLFPFIDAIQMVGTGDGMTTAFNGTLNDTPILGSQGQRANSGTFFNFNAEQFVTFSTIDANNNGIVIIDSPQANNNYLGNLLNKDTSALVGTINYLTGVWNITFDIIPANTQQIFAIYYPYVANRPNTILYYGDQFIVRPVPDKPYPISMQVYNIPAPLVNQNDLPALNQWWEYIAYGAAKKIFEDRMDNESVQAIMPEFLNQEMLVQRRTIQQRGTQRAATIYSNLNSMGWQWGNNFPGSY